MPAAAAVSTANFVSFMIFSLYIADGVSTIAIHDSGMLVLYCGFQFHAANLDGPLACAPLIPQASANRFRERRKGDSGGPGKLRVLVRETFRIVARSANTCPWEGTALSLAQPRGGLPGRQAACSSRRAAWVTSCRYCRNYPRATDSGESRQHAPVPAVEGQMQQYLQPPLSLPFCLPALPP